jgi:hypothetical protein
MEAIPEHRPFQFSRWHGWRGSIIPFARAKIFNNRVEQGLVDIQFGRNSSGLFEIVGGDMVRVADNINRDRIYEHAQNLRDQ